MTKHAKTPTISENVSNFEDSYQNTPPPDPVSECLGNEATSKPSRLLTVLKSIRFELLALLLAFSLILPKITLTSMIVDKVCLSHFKYPQYICSNLQNYTELKPAIERMAANYQMGHSLITTVPAGLLGCFIGPWSDLYGRKLPVFLAVAGMSVDMFLSAVCAYYIDSRVEYLYIGALFYGCCGGVVSLMSLVFSFVCDLVPYDKRTLQYIRIEVTSGISMPLGAMAGGWIYNFLGYYPVFLISAVVLAATLLVIICLFPETRGLDKDVGWGEKFKELFTCETFKKSFIATVKKRPNKGRKQIILLIVSTCFLIVSTTSTSDINYLYVHHQFDWKNTKYSTISALYSLIAVVILLTLIPFLKRIKITDPVLGLIGSTSMLIKFVGIGLSFKEIIFHIASVLGVLSSSAQLAARSRISKVVSNDDIGKVFSLVATAEILLPVFTSIIIAQIFNAFLTIFPGMPYLFLAVSLIFPFSVFAWLTCLPEPSNEEVNGIGERQKEKYVEIKP